MKYKNYNVKWETMYCSIKQYTYIPEMSLIDPYMGILSTHIPLIFAVSDTNISSWVSLQK